MMSVIFNRNTFRIHVQGTDPVVVEEHRSPRGIGALNVAENRTPRSALVFEESTVLSSGLAAATEEPDKNGAE